MVLAEEVPVESAFSIDDGVDRLFTFEVMKTREEEENVTTAEGFEVLFPSQEAVSRLNDGTSQ